MGRLVTQTYSSIWSKRHAYVWGSIRLVIALASAWIIESRVTSKWFPFNQYWGFDFASQLQASAQYCQSHLWMKIAHSTSFYEWECVGGVGEKHRKTIRKKVGNIAEKIRKQIRNMFEQKPHIVRLNGILLHRSETDPKKSFPKNTFRLKECFGQSPKKWD